MQPVVAPAQLRCRPRPWPSLQANGIPTSACAVQRSSWSGSGIVMERALWRGPACRDSAFMRSRLKQKYVSAPTDVGRKITVMRPVVTPCRDLWRRSIIRRVPDHRGSNSMASRSSLLLQPTAILALAAGALLASPAAQAASFQPGDGYDGTMFDLYG